MNIDINTELIINNYTDKEKNGQFASTLNEGDQFIYLCDLTKLNTNINTFTYKGILVSDGHRYVKALNNTTNKETTLALYVKVIKIDEGEKGKNESIVSNY